MNNPEINDKVRESDIVRKKDKSGLWITGKAKTIILKE